MFFSYLERCREICFPQIWYIFTANSHHFVAKSVHKYCKSTRHFRHCMLLAIGTCALVFYINMCHDWKKYNQSQLKKEKHTLLQYIWQQNDFLSHIFTLKMDNFVLEVKPKKICKLNKLKH